MTSATFAWYALTSFRNRALQRLRRLREARYLLSALVGVMWFFFFVIRHGGKSPVRIDGATGDAVSVLIVTAITFFIGTIMLLAWALPGSDAGLDLNEAEVQFLFPAPLSRSSLVLFVILRAQLPILFSSLLIRAIVFRGQNFVGVWALLATLQTYFLMVRMGRARLAAAGIGFVLRILAVLVVLGIVGALLAGDVETAMKAVSSASSSADFASVRSALFAALKKPIFNAPLDAVFFIPALMAKAVTASTLSSLAMPVTGLALFASLCALIAARLDVSYEDATIERAKKRMDKRTAASASGRMRRVTLRHTPAPFALGETGPPEVAIVWKNLIAAGRTTLPILMIPITASLLTIFGVWWKIDFESAMTIASGNLFLFAGIAAVFGPLFLRNDLRADFERLDMLRAYPINGPRMVGAQITSSAVVVGALTIGLALLGALCFFPVSPAGTWQKIVAWGPMAVLFTVPLTTIQLLIQNGLVILLPGWASLSGSEARGVEGSGRGILMLLSQAVLTAIALIPAAFVFATGFWLSGFGLTSNTSRAWVGAVPAAIVILGEIALVIGFLGRQLERIDISDDYRVTKS